MSDSVEDNLRIPLGGKILFPLGQQVATPTALRQLSEDDVIGALTRHARGDWGDVDNHDRRANDHALIEDSRLFSVYHSARGVKFWIITESDRSVTTILLPEDY